jgi:hypothetical protein
MREANAQQVMAIVLFRNMNPQISLAQYNPMGYVIEHANRRGNSHFYEAS